VAFSRSLRRNDAADSSQKRADGRGREVKAVCIGSKGKRRERYERKGGRQEVKEEGGKPGLMPRDYPRYSSVLEPTASACHPLTTLRGGSCGCLLRARKEEPSILRNLRGKLARRCTDTRNRAAGCRFCRLTTHITVWSLTPTHGVFAFFISVPSTYLECTVIFSQFSEEGLLPELDGFSHGLIDGLCFILYCTEQFHRQRPTTIASPSDMLYVTRKPSAFGGSALGFLWFFMVPYTEYAV
jgi:hypothetical protein